jgi:cardiolipin synthase
MDGKDRRGESVAVSLIGKLKTIAQMTAIPMLLWHTPIGPLDIHLLGTWRS